jgi:hypothetical protein
MMKKKLNLKLFFIYVIPITAAIGFNLGLIHILQTSIKSDVKNTLLRTEESCLSCHKNISGFEDSHNPLKIGCTSCHLGIGTSFEKKLAHTGMVLIPGNFSNAEKTCGQPNCHPQMMPRMQNNIMNSMNGVVAVDKWVFDESETPTFRQPIQKIGFSNGDKHLRNLCASCHLSNEKTELGPITELSRGGGCLACHLSYSKEAYNKFPKSFSFREGQSNSSKIQNKEMENFKLKYTPTIHPQINLNITNMHCFGCHSRSGRISLNYDGWHETLLTPEEVKAREGYRLLDDGRVVMKVQADVHSELGMLCVDCHTSYELMGDGNYSLHKEDQMKIQCIDCHLTSIPKTQKLEEFDFESKKIVVLLGFANEKRNYLTAKKNNLPIVNTYFENGQAKLIMKKSKKVSEIKKPANVCIAGDAHKNLSCTSCHSSWTPQCIGCHTEYNEKGTMYDLLANKEATGEWLEYPKDLLAERATLGIKEIKQKDGSIKKVVTEFSPGMILTIDKKDGTKKIFKRLFAPGFSHTVRKESRSCESCHYDPLALGYGRGILEYKISGKTGKWNFTPKYKIIMFDGLPEDAWIGFLKQRSFNSTTRDNTRSFTITEQKKILTVGACLSCHKSNSDMMNAALQNFEETKSHLSKKCILPFN